jgi:ubiquinone/menaquinone biosynthesis C-methylase UbiE
MTEAEFRGTRSRLYKEIMNEMPEAREEERNLALDSLKPIQGEKILETGAGSGFFSLSIANLISPGVLIATDPSSEQLQGLKECKNIISHPCGADTLPVGSPGLEEGSFDAIWSGGSFHHVPQKTKSFQDFSRLLKSGGRVVISDVFFGSSLSRHFDMEVAKYCVTGHEVAFLSKEFADSLCYITGFEKPQFRDVVIQWRFKTRDDVGLFLYKIHAMTKSSPKECLKSAEAILGVEEKNGMYCLNWPLTVMTAYKKRT